MKKKADNYLRHILLNRRRNLGDRFLITSFTLLFPDKMKRLKESLKEQSISIIAYSDIEHNLYKQLRWGDYWIKHELIKAFGEMDCVVTDINPDIVIHLFGKPTKMPKYSYKIIWIYSHPDWVNAEVLSQYDKIYCLSSSFIKRINQMGFEAEKMIFATAKEPVQREIKYDIAFVGNSRPRLHYGRKIVRDVGETTYNFKVWGSGWDNILPKKYYSGRYFDNQRLNEIYASSLITLNDHHEDMIRYGFINPRIFDILASGGFCISDKNPGINEIFEDSVPQYESPEHLRELIDFYINHPAEKLRLMKKGREIALSHTWRERAEQFLEAVRSR